MNWFALVLIAFGVFLVITGIQGTYGAVYTFITGQPLPFTVGTTGSTSSSSTQPVAGPAPKNPVGGGTHPVGGPS